MSVDLVSDEAIAAAFWELAEYPEKAPGNRLAFAAACAYIHHRAKELSAALPLLEGGKGEAVAWMIRNKGDGELHWDVEACVFADAGSANEMAECLNDGDPPIWEALPLYTAPQPAAPQPAEPVAGGAVDARIADLSALRSSVQSMRDFNIQTRTWKP